MVADEIIARADGPSGLKAMAHEAKETQENALPKPFFADEEA
jgi:hypothetical protein